LSPPSSGISFGAREFIHVQLGSAQTQEKQPFLQAGKAASRGGVGSKKYGKMRQRTSVCTGWAGTCAQKATDICTAIVKGPCSSAGLLS